LAGPHVDQLGDHRGCSEIDSQAEYRLGLRILFVNIGLDFVPDVDTFGEDPLLEESGLGGNCCREIAMDTALTGKNPPAVRLKVCKAFLARSPAAAGRVQNNAGLTCGIEKGGPFVNGNLLSLGLEDDFEMLHLSCRTYHVMHRAFSRRDTQYARRIANNQLILWRIFQRARLFLLPTFRLRLGFAIHFSTNNQEIFIAKNFQVLTMYATINRL
jgi:hypothetical protein